jgi:hypothetical protein
MLSEVMLNVMMLCVIMLSDVLPNVFMLNVVARKYELTRAVAIKMTVMGDNLLKLKLVICVDKLFVVIVIEKTSSSQLVSLKIKVPLTLAT